MQSLKRELVPWQFKAALQWLTSYLTEEPTHWWPLLSFRLDCYLTGGDDQVVDVCVCIENSRWRVATRDPVTSRVVTLMQSFLIWLYCTCFLYTTVLSVDWHCRARGGGVSVLDLKNWTKDSLNSLSLCSISFCFKVLIKTHSNSSFSSLLKLKLTCTLQSLFTRTTVSCRNKTEF